MKYQIVLGVVTLLLGAYPGQAQTEPAQLTVDIRGFKAPQGQVCLNLFDSSTGFPSDRNQALQSLCQAATETAVIFEDLAPGSYAVSVFHDANEDNELNRNFVGMPTEGFGFSRNPTVRVGPPKFGDAVVLVAGTETHIEIELSYF
ncbi:DUF2141 domain-containing protein [Leptothoe kymatousa]|uniref:DUF2141 domain-containing protein n=1 Tax=Leptothoe kymatousa TAU-MAC 1615 TaxID=2364775 RepID=A0ABS5Y4H3_9CYAN|nr:DUF2141 domain-containing protein [Leptothoe kymatousa]MBT9312739.1 DUF2141 domain-containing protein [Leptothoe kymatousa TAU-MAC 1615]